MKELRVDMNSNADSFRKELENIRRNIKKLENSFAKMQTEIKAQKSKMKNAEEQSTDLEDRTMEITQSGQQTENQMKKCESNMRDLWNNIKHEGFQKEKKKKRGLKIYFMAGNFPNLKKETGIQIKEAQRALNKLNPNRPTPRHSIIKMAKVKR